jgi:hypothetical protein
MIYVIAELGSAQPVGEVRLLPGPDGISGSVQVESSVDGVTWELAGPAIDSGSGDWLTAPIGREAAAIRVVITNQGGAITTGGIAELRVVPPK